MEEIVLDGIVVSSKDFKEKDKIITIYTPNKGLVSLSLRGVKGEKAKLKIAKELFCFGKYRCFFKGNMGTVIGFEPIETFYALSQDIDKYIEASIILSTIKQLGKFNESNLPLFYEVVYALMALLEPQTQKDIVICKFLVDIFQSMGYRLNIDFCSNCFKDFGEKIFFNTDIGAFVCEKCHDVYSIQVENVVKQNILKLVETDLKNIHTLKLSAIKDTYKILALNYKFRFDKELFKFSL